MSNANSAIGIDLGGTKVAAGIVQNGEVTQVIQEPTAKSFEELTLQLVRMIETLDSKSNMPLPIGLGLPGPVLNGQSTFFSNLPGINHQQIERVLEEQLRRRVYCENDANLAALAEARYGSASGSNISVYLTWSTGIGAGIVIHGSLLPGRTGMAGEIGHTRMSFYGTMDGSGTQGTLESQSSGASLARDAIFVYGQKMDASMLFELAAKGDFKAQKLLENAAAHLGLFIHNLQLLLDPDVIVLGGGLINRADILLPLIESERRKTGALRDFTPLRLAQLGHLVGVIGAAELASEQENGNS